MQITVMRGAGDRPGPDVIEPLLTTEQVARARGRREVDYHYSGRTSEQCQCPKHDFIETGALVQITESERQWRGVVKYFSLTLSVDETGRTFSADTGLHIEREKER